MMILSEPCNIQECNIQECKPDRNTFGITDKEGNRLPDIITAYIEEITVTMQDYKNGYIQEPRDRHKPFKLLLNHKAYITLKTLGETKLIVSFQVRQSGCYAIARLPHLPNQQDIGHTQ